MVEEHKMIDPFEPDQVRYIDNKKVVSFGTSSYGYDIRCSDEFKLFTNVHSAIVDPKNFDPNSFVDVKADHVIIPPNSFCLARTIEYFRIPRNVLTVCLGKSTYARCFSEDTKVLQSDGNSLTLYELATKFEKGTIYRGYSVNKVGEQVISNLEFPRFIGRDNLIEVTLESGKKIHCTPDHKFMKFDGVMVEACKLKPNDLLRGVNENNKINTLAINNLKSLSLNTLNKTLQNFQNSQRIMEIKDLKGEHDVYCLTVPEYGNFALEAGVIVSNCGIIVNVTPFEPEWEGHVTLEFSNTTPLPAKIYANEGCAQVLFFEADEDDICETSYKDRGGKYQGQVGVTTPKL